MISLTILTWVALGFAVLALLLWGGLLVYRVRDNRRIAERQATRDRWLGKLVELADDHPDLTSLPKVASQQEMEDVLGLLRDLAERFRGQYRDYLSKVLAHIGAEAFAMDLLGKRRRTARVRGCALLAWMGASAAADARLREVLSDPDPVARLEACHALASRRAITVTEVLTALRGTPGIDSVRTRDVIRVLAPGRSEEIATLLSATDSPREMELLLEALAESGDFAQGDRIAIFLDHEQPLVTIAATHALGQLGNPAHMPQVARLTHHPDRRVRLCVARYFATMAQPRDTDGTLETLARDPDFDVQRAGIYALVKLGGERLIKFQAGPQSPLSEALLIEATSANQAAQSPR